MICVFQTNGSSFFGESSHRIYSMLYWSVSSFIWISEQDPIMPPSKRDDLIDAAMRVFYRNGFHASGLDKVLQEGGVSRMTLYNHFKSKDELIIAALRRRDEIFRNQMMKFVQTSATDPTDQLLAVFDFHEQWFTDSQFCGCMFINASAEFHDPASPPRCLAADTKLEVIRFLRELCSKAHASDPDTLADQLNLLLEGAIVSAHVVGKVRGTDPGASARIARNLAERLIRDAKAA